MILQDPHYLSPSTSDSGSLLAWCGERISPWLQRACPTCIWKICSSKRHSRYIYIVVIVNNLINLVKWILAHGSQSIGKNFFFQRATKIASHIQYITLNYCYYLNRSIFFVSFKTLPIAFQTQHKTFCALYTSDQTYV